MRSCGYFFNRHQPKRHGRTSTFWVVVLSIPDNVRMRHLDCECHKVALHPGSDVEGTSCRVHAGAVLGVGDLLEHNLDLVEPASVVDTLPDQLNGRLSVILVHKRHVHVVYKVD